MSSIGQSDLGVIFEAEWSYADDDSQTVSPGEERWKTVRCQQIVESEPYFGLRVWHCQIPMPSTKAWLSRILKSGAISHNREHMKES